MSSEQTVTRLKRAAAALEVSCLVLALVGLGYRSTLYWLLPASQNGAGAGLAPMLDFAIALLLFAVCLLCAGTGVAISLHGGPQDKRHAYRAFSSACSASCCTTWCIPICRA